MPPAFEFLTSEVELWVPLRVNPTQTIVQVVASMRPGEPLPAVQSAMRIVAHQLESEEPTEKAGLDNIVSPWRDEVSRKYQLSVVFIVAAVGLVLLIACADGRHIATLRALRRQKEIAIRASLGAACGAS